MPPRRFKGNRKYELIEEGVAKRFTTKTQIANRRWVLERVISRNREDIAETERRVFVQSKELEIIRRIESEREKEKAQGGK